MKEQDIIKNLGMLKEVKPREEWRIFGRELLLKQISIAKENSKENPVSAEAPFASALPPFKWFGHITQPVMAVFLIGAIILGGGLMSVWASKNSLPGDSLYIAKIMNEKAQYALTFDEEKKARLGLDFAGNRAKELKVVLQSADTGDNKNKDEQVEQLVNNFKKEINNAKNRIAKINEGARQSDQPAGLELPITTEEQIIENVEGDSGADPAKVVDTTVFSANLEKDDQGIEISDSALPADQDAVEEKAAQIEADSAAVPTTTADNLDSEAEAIGEASDPGQAILEAQTLLDRQDFAGTLSKLEEADSLISQVEQGEVKGTSTSAVVEEAVEEEGKVLGAEEEATSTIKN